MARQRDYRAERARRNALARERGYTSLDAQARARRSGNASEPTPPRYTLPPGVRTLAQMNKEADAWSRQHSLQVATRYNTKWSVNRRISFYEAFVMKHGGRQVDKYIDEYPDDFDSDIVAEIRSTGHYYGKR